jgi:trigger factor
MVSMESTQGLERRMKVEVPAERVEGEIEKRLKEMGRSARIKGFRPGKAPLTVIRRQYGARVRDDVVSEIVQQSWFQAVSENQLRPVGRPRIETPGAQQGKDLTYTAVFEVFPEIELSGHEGIEVERPIATIEPADVDAMIERLRTQRSHWHLVERAATQGDRVTVDFEGTIDGEPFQGGAGKGVGVVLGEGRMLMDFEAGLVGLAAGEERKIRVEFPGDYGSPEIAGKTAQFTVKAQRVEELHLPEVDDEFCRSFGVEDGSVEQLRSEVQSNMHEELNQRVRSLMKRQLLDKLVAANTVELPGSLIEQEIQALREDMARRMNPGVAPGAAPLPPREPFEAPARFRVTLGLLIGEIVREQQVRVDAAQVNRRLEMIASDYENPAEIVKLYRSNAALMSQVETAVLEEQVVDWLLERASITDKPMSFNALMNLENAT